jgi:hypothetical protein
VLDGGQSRYPVLLKFGVIFKSGAEFMSKKNRWFVLVSLVPAFVLAGVFAAAQAQDAGSAAKQTNWSDPATWPNHKVPVAGDKVTIEKGKNQEPPA